MKILVTGALGFIGSHFVKYLLDNYKDIVVVGVDNSNSQKDKRRLDWYINYDKFNLVQQDICGDISDLLEDVDVVVHFAAKTFVDHSVKAPKSHFRNNVFGTFKLVDEIRKIKVYKKKDIVYVHISTDEVYGQIEQGSFDENCLMNPTNPYSTTKAAAEMLVHGWCNCYDIPFIITRTENNYGSYQHPQKVLPVFIKKALNDENLPIYGDGKHKRMWLRVEDHCSAIWFLIEKQARGIFNIGAGQELENIQLANKVLWNLGRPVAQKTFIPDEIIRPVHDKRYALDSRKIEQLGWKPTGTLDEGLEEVIKWYVENQWWLY